MPNNIGEAYIQIKPSMEGVSGEIEKAMGGAGAAGSSSFGSAFGSGLKKTGAVIAGATAAVASATAAVTGTLVSQASATASYGDNIDKMSQKLGISAEAYQEWDAVMQHSGTSIDSFQMGIKTMNSQLVDAADVISETMAADLALEEALDAGTISFEEYNEQYEQLYEGAYDSLGALGELGFSMEEISAMSGDSELALNAIIGKLQEMPEGTERAALATELLGRSAMELGPLLNTSAEETQAMKDRVHELGGVMSDEAVKNAAAFQDQLQDMQTSFQGVQRSLTSQFLPSLTTVMGGLTEIFSGNSEEGLALINEGINAVVTNLSSVIPELMTIGTNIVMALGDAIIQNLPTLITAGVDMLVTLIQGIIEALPMIIPAVIDGIMLIVNTLIENAPLLIDGALALLMGLVDGLIQNLPTLIPAVVDMVLTIVDKLTQPDTLVMLIDAALQLIIALAEGLIKALPQLIAKAPEIIMNLAQALIQAFPMILEAAIQLIATLIEGIVSCFSQIIETGKNIVAQVKDGLMQKIEEAKTWGKDMIQNFIDGIKSKISAVKDAISGIAKSIKDFLGFSEPDMGPLSNFHTYAPDMLKLFADGIRENVGLVTSAVDDMANGISGEMTVNANVTGRTSSGLASYEIASPQMAMAGAAAGGDVVIPVYIGNERIDEIVVKANQRANYRSGGR